MSECNGKNIAIAFFAGATVGAVAALLMAPQSGKETREKIGSQASKVRETVAETYGTVREKIRGLRHPEGAAPAEPAGETGKA